MFSNVEHRSSSSLHCIMLRPKSIVFVLSFALLLLLAVLGIVSPVVSGQQHSHRSEPLEVPVAAGNVIRTPQPIERKLQSLQAPQPPSHSLEADIDHRSSAGGGVHAQSHPHHHLSTPLPAPIVHHNHGHNHDANGKVAAIQAQPTDAESVAVVHDPHRHHLPLHRHLSQPEDIVVNNRNGLFRGLDLTDSSHHESQPAIDLTLPPTVAFTNNKHDRALHDEIEPRIGDSQTERKQESASVAGTMVEVALPQPATSEAQQLPPTAGHHEANNNDDDHNTDHSGHNNSNDDLVPVSDVRVRSHENENAEVSNHRVATLAADLPSSLDTSSEELLSSAETMVTSSPEIVTESSLTMTTSSPMFSENGGDVGDVVAVSVPTVDNSAPSSSSPSIGDELMPAVTTVSSRSLSGLDLELACETKEDCPEHSQCESSVCRCVEGHCSNNATCLITNVSEVVCLCRSGFSGARCEFQDQTCGEFVCQNGGACDHQSNRCLCPIGFHGEHCEQRQLTCEQVQCQNGGSCQSHSDGHDAQCICSKGFQGHHCEENIDDCVGEPCLNGGVCRDGIDSYNCDCRAPFFGTNCTEVTNPCEELPCENNGTCNVAQDRVHFTCSCPLGFTGQRCETNIDDCAGVVCGVGEICYDLIAEHRCACPLGYKGVGCSERINFCANVTCVHGQCINGFENATCACQKGYTGEHCEADIDECVDKPCVNGICVNQEGNYLCFCRPGFTGSNCQLDIDECLSNPCKNGANCTNLESTYRCECPLGYEGQNCEDDIDECRSNPCLNGSECHDMLGAFNCTCAPGFEGARCESDIDECLGQPCKNGGACINKNAHYECQCPVGYEGSTCELDINECATNPCMNGATCWDKVGAFECQCLLGYEGTRCELNIDECTGDPCLNGGMCLDLVDAFACNCTGTGFEGAHCERNIDECASNPCGRPGTKNCEDGVLNYTCHCHRGFTGRHCEIDIDECESAPCFNGGTCVQRSHERLFNGSLHRRPDFRLHYEVPEEEDDPGFSCHCVPGFEGANCEQNKDDCEIHACQNGGTCIDEINSYSCRCPPGFEGAACQYLSNPCILNPCRNGATCIKKSNETYMCECALGFVGDNCERRRTCFASDCHHDFGRCVGNKICACLPSPSGYFNRAYCDPIWDCSIADLCLNGGHCKMSNASSRSYSCDCTDEYDGLICEKKKRANFDLLLALIITLTCIFVLALTTVFFMILRSVKRARATRGTYSPSTQEMYGNATGDMLKPPPEERLI